MIVVNQKKTFSDRWQGSMRTEQRQHTAVQHLEDTQVDCVHAAVTQLVRLESW